MQTYGGGPGRFRYAVRPETDHELRARVRTAHLQQEQGRRYNIETEIGYGLDAIAEYYGLRRRYTRADSDAPGQYTDEDIKRESCGG